MSDELSFQRDKHIRYFQKALGVLPARYSGLDPNRMTLAYFAVSGLDLLDHLHLIDCDEIIDWVFAQQVVPQDPNDENIRNCGFRGGSFVGRPYDPQAHGNRVLLYDHGHLAMTYTALAILKILTAHKEGYKLDQENGVFGFDDRLDRKSILTAMPYLQRTDGSFQATSVEGEQDMRFIFCAAAISEMLGSFSGIDIDRACNFISSSQSYDAGFAQGPGQEAHGGSTYCAISALTLMKRLNCIQQPKELLHWCLSRQISGFQGRPNKDVDTCYSFWIGATLANLGAFHLVDQDPLRQFILSCQGPYGGIAKSRDADHPDLLHSYMATSGLSLIGLDGVQPLDPALGISVRASQGHHRNRPKPSVVEFFEQ